MILIRRVRVKRQKRNITMNTNPDTRVPPRTKESSATSTTESNDATSTINLPFLILFLTSCVPEGPGTRKGVRLLGMIPTPGELLDPSAILGLGMDAGMEFFELSLPWDRLEIAPYQYNDQLSKVSTASTPCWA